MLGYATYTAAGTDQLFLAPNPILWTPSIIGTWPSYLDGGGEYIDSMPPSSLTPIRVSLSMPGTVDTASNNNLVQEVTFLGNGGAAQLSSGETGPGMLYWEQGTTYATSESLNVSQFYLLDSTAMPTPGPLLFSMFTNNLDVVNFTGLLASLSFMSWTKP